MLRKTNGNHFIKFDGESQKRDSRNQMHVASTSHTIKDLHNMIESDVSLSHRQHQPIMASSSITSPWPLYDEMSDSNVCEEFSNSSIEEVGEGIFPNLQRGFTHAVEDKLKWERSKLSLDEVKSSESFSKTGKIETGQTNDSFEENICCGCQRKIEEQYLLNISGSVWHESCAKCCMCDITLTSSCFLGGHRLYCKKDYDAIRKTCRGCGSPVHDDQLIVRIVESPFIYHVTCFSCITCKQLMQKGDEFVFNQNENLQEAKCKTCWKNGGNLMVNMPENLQVKVEQEVINQKPSSPDLNSEMGESLLSPKSNSYLMSPKSDDDDDALTSDEESTNENCTKEGNERKRSHDDSLSKDSKRSKRPRTILNAVQRRAFKIAFELTPKPCRKVREKLAHDTGLTVRVVQVWFQNQRAKVKKIAKRHHTQEVAAQKAREELGLHMFDPMMPIHHIPSNMLHGCDVTMDPMYVQMHNPGNFSHLQQQGEALWEYQREEMQHSGQPIYHNNTAPYRPHAGLPPNVTMTSSMKDGGPMYTPNMLSNHQDTSAMLCGDVTHHNMDVSSRMGDDVTGAINGLYSMQNQYFNS